MHISVCLVYRNLGPIRRFNLCQRGILTLELNSENPYLWFLSKRGEKPWPSTSVAMQVEFSARDESHYEEATLTFPPDHR